MPAKVKTAAAPPSSQPDEATLLATLKTRFEKNKSRHPALDWAQVEARLRAQPRKLRSLQEMEDTGGEPDVVMPEGSTGELVFFDCSAESPSGRRSLCYDDEALEARKEHKPAGSAAGMAASMGVELMSEEEYQLLQRLGTFDTKTSSWLRAPADVRALGGAIFGDRRFDRVFIYHNGVQSYYGARGFRSVLHI
jgi:hypothetical protein